MNRNAASIVTWFFRERAGLILPQLRGVNRLVVDLPILFVTIYTLYRVLRKITPAQSAFVFTTFTNPLVIAGILCILAYQIGQGYLRDQVISPGDYATRVSLLVKNNIVTVYRERFGESSLVRILARLRIAAAVFSICGIFWANWARIVR